MGGTFRRTYIRQWRKHRGLTQERLAERVGLTHGTVSKIERGLKPYSQPLLEAFAEALQTDPASLLIRDPTDPEGIWTVWDSVPQTERPKAIRVLKAIAGQGG